jgi:TrmH family RNA methyltransferase
MRRGPEPIRSRTNPHVRRARFLRDRGERGVAFVEGVRLLEEALRADVPIEETFVTLEAERRNPLLLDRLRARGVTVRILDEGLLSQLSELETSEGVVALARRPPFDEAQVLAGIPLVVVLCGIQNPGNVGALLRTAEASGATGALLTRGSADPFSWKALRGSMGSAFRLPHVFVADGWDAAERLKAKGVRLVGAARNAPHAYDALDWKGGTALFLGNEGAGLSDAILGRMDLVVSVPMKDPVESLNVGAAAAVLLFEAARQRRGPPPRGISG